jgi:RNA polymerase sigma factor (sigma-70 family)
MFSTSAWTPAAFAACARCSRSATLASVAACRATVSSPSAVSPPARLRGDSHAEAEAVSPALAAKLLARLSPEDRLVLVMLDVEGLSVAEIASLQGWTLSKVKVRAHRARAHLRRVLQRFL